MSRRVPDAMVSVPEPAGPELTAGLIPTPAETRLVRELDAPTIKPPAEMVSPPLKVLAAESCNSPPPVLVMLAAVELLEIGTLTDRPATNGSNTSVVPETV